MRKLLVALTGLGLLTMTTPSWSQGKKDDPPKKAKKKGKKKKDGEKKAGLN